MSSQPRQSHLRTAGVPGGIPLPRVNFGPELARPQGVSDASWAAAGWWAREMGKDPVVDTAGARRFRIELSRRIEEIPPDASGKKLVRIEYDPDGVLLAAAQAAEIDYRFGFPNKTSMSIEPDRITVGNHGQVLGHIDLANGGGDAPFEYVDRSVRIQFEGPGS